MKKITIGLLFIMTAFITIIGCKKQMELSNSPSSVIYNDPTTLSESENITHNELSNSPHLVGSIHNNCLTAVFNGLNQNATVNGNLGSYSEVQSEIKTIVINSLISQLDIPVSFTEIENFLNNMVDISNYTPIANSNEARVYEAYNGIKKAVDFNLTVGEFNSNIDQLLGELPQSSINNVEVHQQIISIASVAKKSFEYWKLNSSSWELLFNNYSEAPKPGYQNRIVGADIDGAWQGALTGAIGGGPIGGLLGGCLGSPLASGWQGMKEYWGW